MSDQNPAPRRRPKPKPRARPFSRPKKDTDPTSQGASHVAPVVIKSDPDGVDNIDITDSKPPSTPSMPVSAVSNEIEETKTDSAPPEPPLSAPLSPVTSLHVEETSHINEKDSSPENDEIIREIDVFISPSLSSTLTLVQFPLHPRRSHHASNYHQSFLTPESARLRPVHNILELDYPLPAQQDSSRLSSLPSSIANLAHRTLRSHSVGLNTHLAIGGWSQDGKSIHLTPLSQSVLQMRPTFAHIDAAEGALTSHSGTTTQEDLAAMANKNKPQPIFLKSSASGGNKGGANSNSSQRQTYAEKKAQEESEDWSSLNVYGPGSTECKEQKKKIENCFDAGVNIQFGACNGRRLFGQEKDHYKQDGKNYIKTLDYLPQTHTSLELNTFEEEDDVENVMTENNNPSEENANYQERKNLHMIKSFASKIAAQMIRSEGCPLPYMALYKRYLPPASAIDENMLSAFATGLSGSSVLIRGSCFVLKSSLMTWLHPSAKDMRDLILILLNRDGVVMREKLLKIDIKNLKGAKLSEDSEDDDEEDSDAELKIKAEIIQYLLSQVANKEKNCWVAKYDDGDGSFERDFPIEATKHYEYWEKRKRALKQDIEKYDAMQ